MNTESIDNDFYIVSILVTSRISSRGHRIGAVHVCVCLCDSTLMAKLFDPWPWFFVWVLTLTLGRLGLQVKGQGHQVKFHYIVIKHYGEIASPIWATWPVICHVTSQYDLVASCDITLWRHITNFGAKWLGYVRSGRCVNAQAFSFHIKSYWTPLGTFITW